MVEPACGAALAVIYGAAAEIQEFETLLVVVCGGATATVEQLQEWSANL